jgi:VIT1/CCC1 family predicted Fe2+/Mn2+ transporter
MSTHHHHHEHHNKSSESLRDFVIGMSDGLTVPFALAAGLAGAVDTTTLIVVAGAAEIAAGTIAMGLGGYMGAKTEKEHYDAEHARETYEVDKLTHVEIAETQQILKEFGVPPEHVEAVTQGIMRDPKKWVDFMMKFELGLERPDPRRLYKSPLIIGGAYAVGGTIPLLPFVFIPQVQPALELSIAVSLVALFAFGAFKGRATGQPMLKGALQTTLIGALAAGAAFLIARLIS